MTSAVSDDYRAAREAAAIAARADRAQLRLGGRDPVKMLHGLITNDLAGAPAGRGVYAAMLTPKGRVITELRAFKLAREGGTEVLVDVPRETLEATMAHLRKFVPPMFAGWTLLEESRALGVYGPRARELLGRVLRVEVPRLVEDAYVELSIEGDAVLVIGTRYAGGEEGFDLIADAAAAERLREALLSAGGELGATELGAEALETLRIEGGRPRGGYELTEATIATEAFESTGQMERAISFTKGCYTGQEVIVRIAHRGHVNRHLRGLRLGAAPAPDTGSALFSDEGKEVGRVTSAAHSEMLGETVALGYVRREVEPGSRVRVGAADGAGALVTELPFAAEE